MSIVGRCDWCGAVDLIPPDQFTHGGLLHLHPTSWQWVNWQNEHELLCINCLGRRGKALSEAKKAAGNK